MYKLSECLGGTSQSPREKKRILSKSAFLKVAGINLLRLAIASVLMHSVVSEATAGAVPSNAASALTKSVAISSSALKHDIAVFEKDDRTAVPKTYSSLKKKIGLLYNGQSELLCTAFCVAPNVIATAAHCLFGSQRDRKPNLSEFSFRIDTGSETIDARLAGSRTHNVNQHIVAGTRGLRTTPPMDAPRDWALAKLQTPSCKFGSLKLAPKPLDKIANAADQKSIFQIAFHWDYEHWKLAYSGPCRVKRYEGRLNWNDISQLFAEPEALVLHTCDTGGASSGSPILYKSDQPGSEPIVVGINVGTYEQSDVRIKEGKIIQRSRAEIIANTGVNVSAFAALTDAIRDAEIIQSREDLKWLQTALKIMGHYDGQLDGNFGPTMRNAITAYQARRRLPQTGLPTHTMLKELTGRVIQSSSTTPSLAYAKKNKVEVPIPTRKPSKLVANQLLLGGLDLERYEPSNFAARGRGNTSSQTAGTQLLPLPEFVTTVMPATPE